MSTPTYWMELDKSSNDGASEKVLYDSVSILIATEKLRSSPLGIIAEIDSTFAV